ncbi:MAG: Ig domain-containing protein [Thomasclavelia spiroformis]
MGILTSCNNNSSSTPISNSSSTNSGTSSQGSSSSQVVKVEDIKISLDNNELKINQEKQINLTILPTNATNQKVTYTVSNDVVTVSTSGLIKANKAGTSVITATSEDGKKTSSLNVYVSKSK